MYGIYNIYNNNDLIYIGKTNNFYTRLKNHIAQQPWNNEITHIAIAECKTKVDMDLYEKYYINKLNPKYNKAIVYNESPTFAVEELDFKKFTLEKFFSANKSKDSKSDNVNKTYEKRRLEIDELLKTSMEIKRGEKIDFLNSTYTLYNWNNPLKTIINFLHIEGNLVFFKHILEDIKNNKCKESEDKYEFIFKNGEDIFRNSDKYHLGVKIYDYSISEKRISKGFSGINFISEKNFNPKTGIVTVGINKFMLDEYFNKYFVY